MSMFNLREIDLDKGFYLKVDGMASINLIEPRDLVSVINIDLYAVETDARVGRISLSHCDFSDPMGDLGDRLSAFDVANYDENIAEMHGLFFNSKSGLILQHIPIDPIDYTAIVISSIYLDPSVRGTKGLARRFLQQALTLFSGSADFTAIKIAPFEGLDDKYIPLPFGSEEFVKCAVRLAGFLDTMGFAWHQDNFNWMYLTRESLLDYQFTEEGGEGADEASNELDDEASNELDDELSRLAAALSRASPALDDAMQEKIDARLFSFADVLSLMRGSFMYGAEELTRLQLGSSDKPIEALLAKLEDTSAGYGMEVEMHFVQFINHILSGEAKADGAPNGETVH